ncbi:MAG: hypothetical protein KIT10_10000 [Flavobacteriales bacterium]|nr:hypothetical protein [Flavobacteriales bacterium]
MKHTSRSVVRLMRRTALPLVAVSLLAACQSGPSEAELAAQAEVEALRNELQTRDALIDDMTQGFGEIERNLELLDERERLIASGEDEKNLDQRQRILRDIQLMNGLVQESRDRIAELNKQLDGRKVEASGLRKRLKEYEDQLAERDATLANLQEELLTRDFRIEQLTAQLGDSEMEVAKREAVIDQQERAINKVYFTVATTRELEERGVVKRSGGFIGLGRTAVLAAQVNDGEFQVADMRETERIPIGAKKATLVTEHPDDSYLLVEEGDELAYLEIKDPDRFWRTSRYMVVAVR